MSWEKQRKLQNLSCSNKMEIKEIDKDGKETIYPTKSNLLIVQDLCQAHYQILFIISEKEFIKLYINIVIVFLNMKVQRTIW